MVLLTALTSVKVKIARVKFLLKKYLKTFSKIYSARWNNASVFSRFSDTKSRALYTPSCFSGRYSHRTKSYKKVTHCLFDLDGTILDSESMYQRLIKDLCARYGKKYTKELEAKNYGGTDHQVCINLIKEFNLKKTPAQLEQELEVLSHTKLPKAPLQKGVERLLTHLSDTGVPFALATNSSRRQVRLHVAARPKLFGLFHHMVCAGDDDVDRGKPYPDIYLIAASKFPDNPKPMKCLVFEDSVFGLEAAVAAGMQVVMTPPGRLPPQYAQKATVILKSLQDFKPEYFGLPPFTSPPEVQKKKPVITSSHRHGS